MPPLSDNQFSNQNQTAPSARIGQTPTPNNLTTGLNNSTNPQAVDKNIGNFQPKPGRSWVKIIGYIFVVLIVLVLIGGGVYAYVAKIGIFGGSNILSEEEFLATVIPKVTQIERATYNIGLSLEATDRDTDAEPFDINRLNTQVRKEAYANDYKRSEDIRGIENALTTSTLGGGQLPASLVGLDNTDSFFYDFDIVDPTTGEEYGYEKVDANNYRLTVNFETPEALSGFKWQNLQEAESIEINGQAVTFIRDSQERSYRSVVLSETPPEPLMLKLGQYISSMPREFQAGGNITAAVAEGTGGLTDWLVNVNAEGDFGDLTYKVNADAVKKGQDYFFKINNIPSLFIFDLVADLKGQWVSISSKVDSEGSPNPYLSGFQEVNENVEKHQSQLVALARIVNDLVGKHNLLVFAAKPQVETINNQELTRYTLAVRKEALIPFYDDLTLAVKNNSELQDFAPLVVDDAYRQYLNSADFDYTFDYHESNSTHSIWLDKDNFPVMVEEKWRLVPPVEVERLADRQVDFKITLELSDINQNIKIEAPTEATPIEEIFNQMMQGSSGSGNLLESNF
ncbi:MAG: hypothetical protein WDZ73_00010 [Candidatus Paceibacterota bacterium]